MTVSKLRKASEKHGDVVYTPDWAAKDMVDHFQPTGRILEPAYGAGAIYNHLPQGAEWTEIAKGRDFFDTTGPYDWVISNPPYSMTRKWFKHSYKIATNLVYLVPLRNVFSGFGFVKEIYEFGGIKELRLYGTGGTLGFPMGNAVGAFHIVKDYTGNCKYSFASKPNNNKATISS